MGKKNENFQDELDRITMLCLRACNTTLKSKNVTWNKIISDYKERVFLVEDDELVDRAEVVLVYDYSKIEGNLGKVFFSSKVIKNPNNENLFDLLHEIGHIMTNIKVMCTCMEEYTATQWALDNYARYGIHISNKFIEEYQKYIYDHRDKNIKDKVKNVPSKKELVLKY